MGDIAVFLIKFHDQLAFAQTNSINIRIPLKTKLVIQPKDYISKQKRWLHERDLEFYQCQPCKILF